MGITPSRSLAGIAILLACLGGAMPGWADLTPPVPPLIPAGFADSTGSTGFFAGAGGVIEAVNLENGQKVWSSKLGSWPLFTRHGWLVAATIGPPQATATKGPALQRKNTLRIRFLKPADGTLLSETAPLTSMGWTYFPQEPVADESGLAWWTRQGYFQLEAWAGKPQRPRPRKDPHEGQLQLKWISQKRIISGFQAPPPEPAVSGRLWLDPASGQVETIPAKSKEPFGMSLPDLPKGWKSGKGYMYWNSSNWSDKPRPFWITAGTAGFIRKETHAPFALKLERWRANEPLPSVGLAEGAEIVPLLGLDGRYLVLAEYKGGKNTYRLCDLFFAAKQGALTELPPFEEGALFKFSVRGDLLLYVTETRKMVEGGGTKVERNLVALDWRKGQVKWRHELAPRFEEPPVAGLQ